MHYDFIEIGTSDFDTLCQSAPDGQVGLSVEPVKVYLDRLPVRPTMHKLWSAMVTDEQYTRSASVDLYLIPDADIALHGLGSWMKGCNSIGKPHEFHTGYYPNIDNWHATDDRAALPKWDLLAAGVVKIVQVPCITWGMLIDQFDIGTVDLLKTDTEGMDADLLINMLIEYTRRGMRASLPKKIQFEDNAHTDVKRMVTAKELLTICGYNVITHPHGKDSWAELIQSEYV
jgi:hypothetical protein